MDGYFWMGFEKRARGIDALKNMVRKIDYRKLNKPKPQAPASTLVYDSWGAKSYNPGGIVSTKGPLKKPVYV